MYPVFYVGFYYMGCVCVSVKTQEKLKIKGVFGDNS